MIRELIVVEGIHDASAVHRAVDAEVLWTGGFMLSAQTAGRIRRAAKHTGVIVLTDPDPVGEQIRRRVEGLARGSCTHAHVDRASCTRGGDVGVEHAPPHAIRRALQHARATQTHRVSTFTIDDLHRHGLVGAKDARARRRRLGEALGIGYANARQLLRRLNHYGVERSEVEEALADLPATAAPIRAAP